MIRISNLIGCWLQLFDQKSENEILPNNDPSINPNIIRIHNFRVLDVRHTFNDLKNFEKNFQRKFLSIFFCLNIVREAQKVVFFLKKSIIIIIK